MITNLARYLRLPSALSIGQHPVLPAQDPIVPALGEPIQAALRAMLTKLNERLCAVCRPKTAQADRNSRDAGPAQTERPHSLYDPGTQIDGHPGGDRTDTGTVDRALPARILNTLTGEHPGKPLAQRVDSADNRSLLQNTEDCGIRRASVHIDREAS